MSLTYGFYNSVNGDRKYNSVQMASIFDGIIKDGVFATEGSAMAVTADSGLTVKVGTGRAWFNHTWTLNDAIYLVTAEASELLLDRIDAVVLEINSSEEVRANNIKIIKGTPSSNPVKPQMVDNEHVHQHPLCYIYRTANSTEITQADITNAIGTTECPFVTGVLSVVTIDDFIAQWSAEFKQWSDAEKEEFTTWFESVRNQLAGDVATNLANQISQHIQNGAHVVYSTGKPLADGAASAGNENSVARSDHRHPTDTSRAPAYSYGTIDLVAGSSSLETGKLHFVYE